MDNLVTKRLAKLRVEALLSEGSLGPVYLARDLVLDRPISLLVVPRPIARRPGFSERFLSAVKAAAVLNHPSIAAIYDIAEQDGEYFLSAEYVSGLSLDSYLKRLHARRQVIQVDEALFLIAQAADALIHAHDSGVAHGDIRPERLLISRLPHPERPGEPPLRVKIAGFGLAALQQETVSGEHQAILATVPFHSATAEDVQALALTFCRMVTSVPPSAPNNGEQSLFGQSDTVPRSSPREVEAQPAIVDILNRAQATLPEARFMSAEELRDSLAQAAESVNDSKRIRSAPVVGGVSLATSVAASTSPAGLLAQPVPIAGTGPLLIVSHPDHQPESHRLDQPGFTIGRSDDNDIVLPAEGVSRRHLRLAYEAEQWLVSDLASTNGTLLDGAAVEPLLPRVWHSGDTLRVGPYSLRWLPELVELESSSFEPHAEEATRLSIEPGDVRVHPGEQARLVVSLLSRYPAARRFRLTVDGLPESWLESSAEFVDLKPDNETLAPLVITPPRSSAAAAGRWPFVVRITIENGRTEQLSLSAQITLLAFVHYTARLEPRVLRAGQTCRLLLRNNGNTTTTFNIQGKSIDNAIGIVAAPRVVRLSPGEDGEADLTLAVRRRPLWGTSRLSQFQVEIHSPGARPQTLGGRILLKPVITPRRLIYALTALFIVTLLALVLFNWTA